MSTLWSPNEALASLSAQLDGHINASQDPQARERTVERLAEHYGRQCDSDLYIMRRVLRSLGLEPCA